MGLVVDSLGTVISGIQLVDPIELIRLSRNRRKSMFNVLIAIPQSCRGKSTTFTGIPSKRSRVQIYQEFTISTWLMAMTQSMQGHGIVRKLCLQK